MAEYTIKINEKTQRGKKLLEYLMCLNDISIKKVEKDTTKNSIIKGMQELEKGETKDIKTLWESL